MITPGAGVRVYLACGVTDTEGMCSGSVTWLRRPGQRGWLATLCPLWKISTMAPQTRVSTSCRISLNGTEYQELSTSM